MHTSTPTPRQNHQAPNPLEISDSGQLSQESGRKPRPSYVKFWQETQLAPADSRLSEQAAAALERFGEEREAAARAVRRAHSTEAPASAWPAAETAAGPIYRILLSPPPSPGRDEPESFAVAIRYATRGRTMNPLTAGAA